MTKVGIVGGKHRDRAAEIKAAVLKINPQLDVIIDETDFRVDTPDDMFLRAGDRYIQVFDSVDRLTKTGCKAVAFSCCGPSAFINELQAEVTSILVDPAAEPDVAKSAEAYAAEIVEAAQNGTAPGKSFKIGMIGGLGPAATVDLYDKIVKNTVAAKDQQHYKLVVEQNPQVPDRTVCLLEDGTDPTIAMYNCAKRLESDGCDVIIVPCNTAHAFVPRIERFIKTPFLNMQRSTMEEIAKRFEGHIEDAKVGLLATSGTISTGIYGEKAKAMGIAMFTPDEENQKLVMSAIYGPKGAKAGFTTGVCHDELMTAARHLEAAHGCNVLILGCTELPLILSEGDLDCGAGTAFVIDATAALARSVVALAKTETEKRGRF